MFLSRSCHNRTFGFDRGPPNDKKTYKENTIMKVADNERFLLKVIGTLCYKSEYHNEVISVSRLWHSFHIIIIASFLIK